VTEFTLYSMLNMVYVTLWLNNREGLMFSLESMVDAELSMFWLCVIFVYLDGFR